MPAILAVVRLPNADGLTKDLYQNSYAFECIDNSTATLNAIGTELNTFYNVLGAYLSPCIDRPNCQVRYYDITGAMHGEPHGNPMMGHSLGMTTTPGSSLALPQQCAVVLHMTGNPPVTGAVTAGPIPTADFAQDEGAPATHAGARRVLEQRTGRVYLGPVNSTVLAGTDPMRATISSAAQSAIVTGFKNLVVNLGATALASVWSRVQGQLNPVHTAIVNEIIHTIRGRVQKPTAQFSMTF